MKKIFTFLILLILISSCGINENKLENKSENKINTGKTVNDKKIVDSLNLPNDNSGDIDYSKDEALYKKILKEQCIKITESDENFSFTGITLFDGNLRGLYLNTKKYIDNESTEYTEFLNIKSLNCDKVKEINKEFCEAYKNKKVIGENGSKVNILLKSLINNKNYCSENTDELLLKECNNTFLDFINLDKKLKIDNFLEISPVSLGKYLVKNSKEEFLKELNKEFIEKCENKN